MLNALERIATSYGGEIVRLRGDNAVTTGQLRDYQERVGKPFSHEAYLGELTTLRDALKARLSGRPDDTTPNEGPETSELATRIKSLKAANTIETGAARGDRKPVTVGESITARIRRRQEDAQAAQAQAPDAVTPQAAEEMSFQQRILRERRQHAEGEGQGPS